MIRVEHLQKTYNLNKKNNTHAINDISFTLPDKGMIFIVGKSGSGKSTLLNILGGLDDFDSGTVLVDGNDLGKMSHSDFNKYRSTYVSFIFQDHFLIDDYNVRDNVALSLNILNENDEEKVKETLEKVELLDKIEAMPQELSGGQRQRVAVARAIIKEPKLILCDEPTGNLDDKTTILVFDLLKELSKNSLVIVVSHDIDNAKIYADRIIEIFNGKILSDKEKNSYYSDKLSIMNDIISIPNEKVLTVDDYEYINKHINENTRLEVGSIKYIDTTRVDDSNRTIKLEKKKFYKKSINHLARIFIRRRLKRMFLTALIVSLIIACFSIFVSLLSFDGNKEVLKKLEKSGNQEVLIRSNCFVDADEDASLKYQSKLFSFRESDLEYFNSGNYKGNIYKLYNYSIGYSSSNNNRNETYLPPERNLVNFYMKESYGTLCCDKKYLEGKFGELKVLKGDINDPKGVIITDYLADSILKHNLYRNSYDEIIGKYYINTSQYDWFYISAIIETDYKTYFKDVMDKYDFSKKNNDLTKVLTSDEFDKFAYQIKMKYGLAYSFSTDFLTDMINEESIGYIPIRYAHAEYDGQDFYMSQNASFCDSSIYSTGLNHGEVVANMRYFNQIFGTDFTSDTINTFEPITVKIKKYYDYTKKQSDEVIGEVEIRIVSMVNSTSSHDFFCRADDYSMFKDVSVINYGLIFDDIDSSVKMLQEKPDGNFYIDDNNVKTIKLISKYVQVFKKLSVLISIVLSLTGLIYLVFYEVSNISSMKKEIGILKACGTEQRTISRIFIYQQIIVCIMVAIVSTLLSYLLIKFSNNLMVTSIEKYASAFISGLTIIKFIPRGILMILALTIIIIMASCTIPILLLIRVKPMNIIKAKE